ncbi:hypothetical protein LJC05_00920 [Bacteroides sp. OttesenSCG-928-J23]|nr:hypothetical protein [Bacteroides sp. OttesenSCG-928-N06]MDL2247277.1 hypothetical protein [Bacteroides sp. OttesenSCG-928-J23]MDL2299383.1 hypothetical protein [Bacteroides sp. OttesenSCG-928-E20]MDL2306000.1 hypothetical protein [Bacteroides sp. OttesenSCG-928-D19]
MKLSQQAQSAIEAIIKQAISHYSCNCERSVVTDIHLQPNPGSAELTVFDDDDQELANALIKEWLSYQGNDFYKDVERVLRTILTRMKTNGAFDKLPILQPYSFVLVDEDKETIAELLLVDEDIVIVNEELLKGLDEELDAFLKELLEK